MDIELTPKLINLKLSTDELTGYRRRFAALDLNKDGIVELREFVAVSKVFGYKLSKEEILVGNKTHAQLVQLKVPVKYPS